MAARLTIRRVWNDGRPLRGDATRPFDSMVQSKPQDISLVIVNGKPIYGDANLMIKFGVTTEPISYCGETKNLNLDVLPNGKLSECATAARTKNEGLQSENLPRSILVPIERR